MSDHLCMQAAVVLPASQSPGNPRAFIELTWKLGRTVGISTRNTGSGECQQVASAARTWLAGLAPMIYI